MILRKALYYFDTKNGCTISMVARTLGEAKQVLLETGLCRLADVTGHRRVAIKPKKKRRK